MINSKRIYFIPVIGFLTIIIFTSILLCFPIFNNRPIEYKDSLFIVTSSISTTGLTTVNVAKQFNFLGQLIIAILMEIGAYGFIVIISYIWSLRNKKISFSNMILINDSISSDDFSSIKEHLLFIGKLMFKVQILGAIFCAIRFVPEAGFFKGIWYSIFHSISSFSNAAIDIFDTNSIEVLRNDIYIQIITIILMFLGSIGILVIEDIRNNKTKQFNRLKLQTQIVITVSVILIIVPTVIFFMVEPDCNIINSLFTSVTTRSTGFTIKPIIAFSETSKIIMILLMLAGGGPASTSGGIRILPLVIIYKTVIATLKGKNQTIIFNRKIPEFLIKKSFVIALLFMIVLFVAISTFYITNNIGIDNIVFECVSAATNTGLNLADYTQLNLVGEMILIILMFIGRVGPLSMFLVFARDDHKSEFIEYPEGNIVI